MTEVVSRPLTDVLWQTRTRVQRDDADVVDHLDENHHVSGRLHNLIVVVVGAGKHWRPRAVHDDATHAQRQVLHRVGGGTHSLSRLCACCRSPLSLRCHGRNSPIRRIDDQRSTEVQGHASLAPVQPKLRKVVVHVGYGAGLGLLTFGLGCSFGIFERFLFGKKLLRDVLRSLQRCIGVVGPKALQIGLAVRCARRSPRLGRLGWNQRLHGGQWDDLGGHGHARQPHHRDKNPHNTC